MDITYKKIRKIITDTEAHVRFGCQYQANNKILYECYENENLQCHLASVTKLFALIYAVYLIQQGQLDPDEKYTLRNDDMIEGQFIVGNLHPGIELTIMDMLRLMIVGCDTFCFDIIFNKYLKESINVFINKVLGLKNTKINLSILELNRKLLGINEIPATASLTWNSLFNYIEENEELINSKEILHKASGYDIHEDNFSTITDLMKLENKLIKREIINDEYFDIVNDILCSQYDTSRICANLPIDTKGMVAHQIGTITDGQSYQIINDCGYIVINNEEFLILNFFCDQIEDEGYKINTSLAEISRLIYDYVMKGV